MRITVFGAGGIGLYFAAMLARAGHRITVVGRPDTVAAAANPLILEHDSAKVEVPGIRAVAEIAGDEGPADLVIVGVKAWQVPTAAVTVAPIVGPNTAVLPLQNGVEAAADLAVVLGAERVVGCSCVVIAQRVAPWAVRCLGADASVEIGGLTTTPRWRSAPSCARRAVPMVRSADAPLTSGSEDRVANVGAALAAAGIAVTRSADIEATLWRKLMLISSYGGVGAIARQPVGVTRDDPETAGLVRAAMQEVLEVARARGIALDGDDVARMMKVYREFSPGTTSSMQRDLAAGRPSELAYQSGAVVRFGRAAGVPTPIHHTIYASQLPAETAARGER